MEKKCEGRTVEDFIKNRKNPMNRNPKNCAGYVRGELYYIERETWEHMF